MKDKTVKKTDWLHLDLVMKVIEAIYTTLDVKERVVILNKFNLSNEFLVRFVSDLDCDTVKEHYPNLESLSRDELIEIIALLA